MTTPFLSLLHGGVYTHAHLQSHFLKLCHRLGIQGLTLHDLRRTAARKVYGQAHDLNSVRQFLSHRRLASSLHYIDPSGNAPGKDSTT